MRISHLQHTIFTTTENKYDNGCEIHTVTVVRPFLGGV